MLTIERIKHYFPEFSQEQWEQFEQLAPLYQEWNAQINVISRKDMEAFNEHHLLHSLAIAKFIQFKPGCKIMDVGTGGGFPGIPLAIAFPEAQFTLVDSIGKKIKVVNAVKDALGLKNIVSYHERAEKVNGSFDFVVSRAVTRLGKFYPWVSKSFNKDHHHSVANGIIYLKGGDLKEELKEFGKENDVFELSNYFSEEFFETKKIVHVPVYH